MSTTSTKTEIEYPDSDGKPLAETGVHVHTIILLMELLARRFAGDPMTAILANMFVYYEEGNIKKRVAPDVFVTLGVPSNPFRRTFKVWEEGKAPDLIIEATSRSTKREAQKTKFVLYQDILSVREYILFDPLSEYLKPSLQGFRLEGGRYVPIQPVQGRMPSNVLGVHVERSGSDLRLFDPSANRWIPTGVEIEAAAIAAQRQGEIDLRRAVSDKQRAEADKQRAEADKQRAEVRAREISQALSESDAARREMERELQKLRRELERRDPGTPSKA